MAHPDPSPTPRARFNLTPFTYFSDRYSREPVRMWADEGAISQQGSKPCFTCDCGAVLVWLKSARTGKSYLATCVKHYNADSYYYMGHMAHTQADHSRRLADAEAFKVWDAPNAAAYEAAREAGEQS